MVDFTKVAVDYTLKGVWGVTLVDVIALVYSGSFNLGTLENVLKILLSIMGIIYFGVQVHHKYHSFIIDRKMKEEDLRTKIITNNKEDE